MQVHLEYGREGLANRVSPTVTSDGKVTEDRDDYSVDLLANNQ
jgi:hypothetical protein